MQYAKLARNIQYAVNDTEIFWLTGCLANCDKYHYIANPGNDLVEYDMWMNPHLARTVKIHFMFSNGRNEVKEQVLNENAREQTLVMYF